jgi:hypothetical protein
MSRMSSGRPPVTGFLTVVLAASLFGMLGPLSRYAYDAGMVPLSFVAWRAGIGFLAAAAFIGWRASRGIEPLTRFGRLDRVERVTLLVAALLGFALNLAMFISFDLITIALALLGFYTYPVIVAVVNVVLGREALDRTRVVALVLAIAGMVAVVAGSSIPAPGSGSTRSGSRSRSSPRCSQAAFVVISRDRLPERAAVAGDGRRPGHDVSAPCRRGRHGRAAALALPAARPVVLPLLAFTGLFAAAIPSILFLTGSGASAGRGPGSSCCSSRSSASRSRPSCSTSRSPRSRSSAASPSSPLRSSCSSGRRPPVARWWPAVEADEVLPPGTPVAAERG